MAITTFYAGAGDGGVGLTGESDWDTLHDATTGNTSSGTSTSTLLGFYNPSELRRGFYPFDTSSIDSGDTVSAATFKISQSTSYSGSPIAGVVQTTQASNTTLANADYNQCGSVDSPTEGATRLTIAESSTTTFTLNSTGRGWVSKTGYTKLGLRIAGDLDDSSPGEHDYARIYNSEETGTSNDPVLTVTHAAAGNPDLEVGIGAFTLTGVAVDLQKNATLTASTGVFSLTGNNVGLIYTPIGASLIMGTGAFTLTGNDVGLARGESLSIGTGAFTLTGNDLNFENTEVLTMETGVFILTGNNVNLSSSATWRNQTKNLSTWDNSSKSG